MKRKTNKTVSILLCVAILLSLVTMTAFAVDSKGEKITEDSKAEKVKDDSNSSKITKESDSEKITEDSLELQILIT